MIMYQKTGWLIVTACLTVMLLGACVSSGTHKTDSGISAGNDAAASKEGSFFNMGGADTKLFEQGLSNVSGSSPEGKTDYGKAQAIFVDLIKNHPKSKWNSPSQILIRLLVESQSGREQLAADKQQMASLEANSVKLQRDNDQLKRDVRMLNEKLAVLAQENEQLRRDMQSLKDLELQLQKRDRSVR